MAEKKKETRKVVLESGIEVKPVYGPEDLKAIDFKKDIGAPGEFPYTRGIHPMMYRERPFTMRQYTGFGTPAETNERFKYLIANGQNALNVAFDLPTQMGLDSDDPLAEGEVGREGMAVDTLRDMEVAFDGVPIDKISVSLTINAPTTILMAMYLAMAEKRGVPLSECRGTTQNDILKEYVGRGAWIFPVEPAMRLIGDTVEFCAKHAHKYYPVSVCGYHLRESGATPVQEIAWAYCIARAYIRHAMERGLTVDEFASRISFNFNIFGNLWEQVAKFRAARRLWARLMRDEFGAQKAETMQMKMLAGGGGAGLTIEEPENNIARGAYYALISALSGAQTMALCCYDEAYTIPTPKAHPLAGSYYIETLTHEMEQRMVEEMRKVDEMGGVVEAVSTGKIQSIASRQAYEYERAIQSGKMIKIGVNKYRSENPESGEVELHPYKQEAVDEQIARLTQVRAERDAADVARKLDAVREAATAKRNVMPAMMDAVKAYASVGEITKVLKDVYGVFKEPVIL
ncbi:MAG: methylmalonyl-CoA mutase [Chloroflexi bacterium]|nr:methylmalonyl-CoA mutase [Chloroflexota bacterium]